MPVGTIGLAPEPVITSVAVTTSEALGEIYSYDSAVVEIEISESIGEEFKTTSWFGGISLADYLTTEGAYGTLFEELQAQFNIASFLTLRVVAVTTEDAYNYIENNSVQSSFHSSGAGYGDLETRLGWTVADTTLNDYLSEDEQDAITQYYYSALSNGTPDTYQIKFEIELDLPEDDENAGQTGFLQFYAYVFWDMDTIAQTYGIDIDGFDWGAMSGPSYSVNYIPYGDLNNDYSLYSVCSERDDVLADFDPNDLASSISKIQYSESILGDECDVNEFSITVSGLWYMNIRTLVMKHSPFGSVFYPSTSEDESFFQDLMKSYIMFDEAVLHRRVGEEEDNEWEVVGVYDFNTGITSGLVDEDTESSVLSFNIIESPAVETAIMYFDDQEAFDLSTEAATFQNEGGEAYITENTTPIYYKLQVAIHDTLVDYFLDVLDNLADAREWIQAYERLALLPCNYNSVNDRFSDFFTGYNSYLSEAYGSFTDFESQLSTAIAAFVVASKLMKCITYTEAPSLDALYLSKLHPDYASPSSIAQTLTSYTELEYILLDLLGFEKPDAIQGAIAGSYRYTYSGDASATYKVSISWNDPYIAQSSAVIARYFDCPEDRIDDPSGGTSGGGGIGHGAGGAFGRMGGYGETGGGQWVVNLYNVWDVIGRGGGGHATGWSGTGGGGRDIGDEGEPIDDEDDAPEEEPAV
tara:strand:- start:6845 stop:8932 length:2088 start_codon:yes stop_codon:yes gene_type:complete